LTNHSSYSIIDEITAALKKHDIRFHQQLSDEDLSPVYYKRLLVIINQQKFSIPVCDEYDDMDQMSPPVMLQLLLREMEYFEDAEDYLLWCKDLGFDAASELCRSIHSELREVVPKLREHLGNSLKAISDFHLEMNTGITQALRAAKL